LANDSSGAFEFLRLLHTLVLLFADLATRRPTELPVGLSLHQSRGAWPLPYTFPQQPSLGTTVGSTIDQNLNAHAVLVLDTTGPIGQAVAVGSAQLLTSGNIDGFEIFIGRTFLRSTGLRAIRRC
jgi:hypothetical protein